MEKHLAIRGGEKMKEVLMDPGAAGPAEHYYMIRGGPTAGNITVWEPGTVGGEYIKTYGHYHRDGAAETYRILAGEGVALLQKRTGDAADPARIEDFRAILVKAGDTLDIPEGYGHLVVNVGQTHLVTEDNSPTDLGHADYEPVKAMHGFAYYVVERGGKPTLIKNSRYAEIGSAGFGGLPVVNE